MPGTVTAVIMSGVVDGLAHPGTGRLTDHGGGMEGITETGQSITGR